MSQSNTLTTNDQSRIADQAEALGKAAKSKARRHFQWGFGFLAASALVAVVFPPAVLPGLVTFIGGIAGVLNTAYGIGNSIDAKAMSGIRKDAGKEGFADKLKSRAQRLVNFSRRADKLSDYSLFGALGFAVLAVLAPAVAPLAWGLYAAAAWTTGVTTLAHVLTRDASSSLTVVDATTQAAVQPAAANQNTPPSAAAPALTQSPAPGPAFDKAANAAPANDTAAPAPVIKAPDAPKP